MTTLINIMEFLNRYSTLALVIITAIYACFTYKMARAISTQITSKIKLSNILVGSALKDKEFLSKIRKINNSNIRYYSMDFYVRADIFNNSAGNGAITKPRLELKFDNGFIKKIEPETKSYKSKKIDETTSEQEVTDYGRTIFIAGGDLVGFELEYYCDLNPDLLEAIKDNSRPSYFLVYLDNHGKAFHIEVKDVISDDQFEEKFL